MSTVVDVLNPIRNKAKRTAQQHISGLFIVDQAS